MFNRVCQTFRNRRGFTLVELMIVIVIIGVLVAIAVPVYLNTTTNAEKRACQANLRTIDGAIAQHQADTGGDPATVAELVSDGYLKKEPECPTGGDSYRFVGSGASLHADCPNGHTYP